MNAPLFRLRTVPHRRPDDARLDRPLVHPLDWYLSVEEHRDVIELPITDDLDINGWKLRKALRLMRKNNPVLLEWLHSPIRYRYDEDFLLRMRRVAGDC